MNMIGYAFYVKDGRNYRKRVNERQFMKLAIQEDLGYIEDFRLIPMTAFDNIPDFVLAYFNERELERDKKWISLINKLEYERKPKHFRQHE